MSPNDNDREIEFEKVLNADGQQVFTYNQRQNFRYFLGQTINKARVCQALMLINIAIFVMMVFTGVHMTSPLTADLEKWGANYYPLTADDQAWRLLTCMFLHVGLMHLAFNMWALKAVGEFIERLYGHRYFLFIYIASGLFASVFSLFWSQYNISVSAGASGAVFGVFGALGAFVVRQKKNIPYETFKYLKSNLFTIIGINVVFGLVNSSIDNAAHLGGLVSGFAIAWCLTRPLQEVAEKQRTWGQIISAVALFLVAFFLTWFSLSQAPVELEKYMASFGEKEKKLVHLEAESRKKTIPLFIEDLEDKILPLWQNELEKIEAIHQQFSTLHWQKKISDLRGSKRFSYLARSGKVRDYIEARATYHKAVILNYNNPSNENYQKMNEAHKKLMAFLENPKK